MQPSSVDFPAPFGPIRHVSEPRCDAEGDVVDGGDGAEGLPDAVDLAGVRRSPCLRHVSRARTGRASYLFVNAVPNRGVGLHEAIRPAHMLGSWIPLWFVRREVEPAAGRREPADLRLERGVDRRRARSRRAPWRP